MDLGEAWIREPRATAMGAPGGGDIASVRVRGQEEYVAVAARGEHDGVSEVGLDLTGDEVAHHHAPGAAVDDDELQHLVPGIHLDGAAPDLSFEGLIGAEQQLLAGLTAGVEGARDLHTAEGPVVQHAAVLAGEGHALCHALVDDFDADLGESIDVGLARAVVAAFDCVVEQPVDAVAVVAVVLGRIDAALCGDAVRPARAVFVAEVLDVVTTFAQRRRGRRAGKPGANDDHRQPAAVRWIDQPRVEASGVPAFLDRALRCRLVGDRRTVTV